LWQTLLNKLVAYRTHQRSIQKYLISKQCCRAAEPSGDPQSVFRRVSAPVPQNPQVFLYANTGQERKQIITVVFQFTSKPEFKVKTLLAMAWPQAPENRFWAGSVDSAGPSIR
jgi:hypothetical protein